jgi:hypothetical protein
MMARCDDPLDNDHREFPEDSAQIIVDKSKGWMVGHLSDAAASRAVSADQPNAGV